MSEGLNVTSKGAAVDNDKAKEQREELERLRASAKKDEEKAKKHREEPRKQAEASYKKAVTKAKKEQAKAQKAYDAREKQVEKAAMAAGGALLTTAFSATADKKTRKRSLLILAVGAVVVVAALLLFRPQLQKLLGLGLADGTMPAGIEDFLPDSTMGYASIDFTNAVLGEAREKQSLIVLEQDVEVDSEVSDALANLAIFKKTKVIHSYGTGFYTVDFAGFSQDSVLVDQQEKTVTIRIPAAKLDHISVDPEKTRFEETEHAFLGFGDVKLTQEQQNELDKSVDAAMKEALNTRELLDQAAETAKLKVRELFQPVVSAISEDFLVVVQQI